MKKMYLFKLVGEDIIDGDNNDFSHPFYTDIAGVIDPSDVKYMSFGNDKTMFIAVGDNRIEGITAVFTKYFMLSITDISNEVLSGSIQKEYPEMDQEYFDEYRLEYTTTDDILDKIVRYGIDSLDKIDKIILDSTSNN